MRRRNGNEPGFGGDALSFSKCLDVLAKEGGEAKSAALASETELESKQHIEVRGRPWGQTAVGKGPPGNLREEMICLFLEIASANEDRKQID